MRLAVSGKLTDEKLAFGRQVGATDFVSGADLPMDAGYFRFQDLVILRNRIEDAGLRLSVVSLPEDWTYKIKLGLPGRDEQIANWCRSIENIGAAGDRGRAVLLLPAERRWELRAEDVPDRPRTGWRQR